MTREIRWRILSLQVVLFLVLAFGAGLALSAHNFTHDQVSTQLSQQQIVFPPANSAAIKALPGADAAAMTKYAGQTMTTGDQAETYANHFIAVHLKEIGQGKTYSYWSGIAINPATPKAKAAVAENTALTLFRGETLRSLLLNGWAFWFVGNIALYAAFGLGFAALVVLGAFLFELLITPKREGVVELSSKTGKPGVAVPVS
jgi:hypothetical protein